jgi:non-ribosomal peptide synthetase component E (peptide arylation enzyme)
VCGALPYPDVAIPDLPLTPFVLELAGKLADKPVPIDGPTGRTLTYGQLAGAIRSAAAGLSRRGFRKGDVALMEYVAERARLSS